MLRQDDYQRSLLVLESWRQTIEYGGHMAACMVMSALGNRVRLGWGSWAEIIQRIPNYSALKEQPNREMFPSIWEPNFVRLLHEVESSFDGSGTDYAKGGLYWCDSRHIERDWFQTNILDKKEDHPRVAEMNSLMFFR